jgi:hypothetical protein
MSSITTIWHGIKDVNGFSRGLLNSFSFGALLLMATGITIVIGSGCTDQKKVRRKRTVSSKPAPWK